MWILHHSQLSWGKAQKTNKASSFNGPDNNGPFGIHENLLLSIDSVSPNVSVTYASPNFHYWEHCTLIKGNNKPVVSRARKYEEASAGPQELMTLWWGRDTHTHTHTHFCFSPPCDLCFHLGGELRVRMLR